MIINFYNQTTFSFQSHSVNKICPVRIDLYHHIGSFYLKSPCVCHIIYHERGVFPGSCVIELIKII